MRREAFTPFLRRARAQFFHLLFSSRAICSPIYAAVHALHISTPIQIGGPRATFCAHASPEKTNKRLMAHTLHTEK